MNKFIGGEDVEEGSCGLEELAVAFGEVEASGVPAANSRNETEPKGAVCLCSNDFTSEDLKVTL